MSVHVYTIDGARVNRYGGGWVILTRTRRSGWFIDIHTFARTRVGAIDLFDKYVPGMYKATKRQGRARAVQVSLEALLVGLPGVERKAVQ